MKTIQQTTVTLAILVLINLCANSTFAQKQLQENSMLTTQIINDNHWVGKKEVTATSVALTVSVIENNPFVAIECSFDNVHFRTATVFTPSVENNTNTLHFTHTSDLLNAEKTVFYRVKTINSFGVSTYSTSTELCLKG